MGLRKYYILLDIILPKACDERYANNQCGHGLKLRPLECERDE
jgi:hypothetical protein